MTTPFWCLFAALFFPYILNGITVYFKVKQLGSVDNRHPRLQATQLEGAGARAWAAQQNAWEALLVFGPAVIVAHLAGADPDASSMTCFVFLGARVLHAICYIANLAPLRTLMFAVGTICCLRLFALSATA